MGIRGELFSTRFGCEGRTYFFNVKENRNGDIFLSVVESKPTETETFDRRSIVVFQENMEGFMRAMRTAAGYMDKAGPRARPETSRRGPHQERKEFTPRAPVGLDAQDANSEGASQRPAASDGAPARTPRRIVIRKKPQSSESPKPSKSETSD